MKGTKTTFSLLVSILFIFGTSCIYAQNGDNPNLDQLPKSMRYLPQVQYRPVLAPVTSSDGYDNFYLGIDFAEPHISSNPLNPTQFFVAYNTNATHYTLNGIDWFTNNPSLPDPAGDPVTAYDSLGNLFYENMYGSISGCYVAVSSNNGVNWASPVLAISGNDKNWIACDQTGGPFANYVYSTMTAGNGYGNFTRSTNHGISFSQMYSFNTQSLPGMMVCVGPKVSGGDVPGGYVYVVTNYGNFCYPYYYFYRSTDGGETFSLASSVQFAGYLGTILNGRSSILGMRTRSYPFITADNSYGSYRGRLYLVYATNVPNEDGAKPDILCRYSTDAGSSWSSPITVNDDANSTGNYQFFPAIWCDKETGKLYVKWYDSRNCQTSDSCDVYATYSTNGGQSFVTNQKISNAKMKIYCSTCGGGGTPTYLGDYDAITSNKYTSTLAWTDFRAGTFGSYTAYFPDFAMTASTSKSTVLNNDSTFLSIKIPSVKLYTDKVKFTAEITPLPTVGTVTLSFVNNKDSLTAYPDSVKLRVKTSSNVTTGQYTINIYGKGTNGTPVHKRSVSIYINAYSVSIGTNRNGICTFKVNGVPYTSRQSFIFKKDSIVNVQAVGPYTAGGTRYAFNYWSDAGDTTHNITITSQLNLTAYYKIQYKCIMSSSYGTLVGADFHDSATAFTFGVYPRIVSLGGGQGYQFRGWNGSGTGSYTSSDSTGLDSMVTLATSNAIVETARWTPCSVGIQQISSEIPDKYRLNQNYPNPFNPVTKIKFQIKESGFVSLNIYDILGRQVATLVNENLNPGYYEVPFIVPQISSGIYFYKISANDFSDIKKMSVVK